MNLTNKKNILFVGFFFWLCSLFFMSPFLNRPLSGHFEWLTAHTLITHSIWEQDGILEHYALPIYTFNDSANYNIKLANLGSLADPNGRFYYISYPSFGFVIPYFWYKLTLQKASPFALQSFNLLLFLIDILLIIEILYFSFSNKPLQIILSIAFFSFSPVVLWFHGNVYFVDILSSTLSLLVVYCFLRYIQFQSKINFYYLFVSLIMLCLTEWIGFLFGTLIVLFLWMTPINYSSTRYIFKLPQNEIDENDLLVYKNIEQTISKKYILLLIFALVFSGIIILFQFSQINGLTYFISTLWSKFANRSGFKTQVDHAHTIFDLKSYFIFLANYIINHFMILSFIIIALIFKFLNKIDLKFPKTLYLLVIPILMHHLILFNFSSGHGDFPTFKSVPFLSIYAAFLLFEIFKINFKQITFVFSFYVVFNLTFFYLRNSPELQQNLRIQFNQSETFKEYANHWALQDHVVTNEFKIIGEYIKCNSNKGEVIFLLSNKYDFVNTAIQYYAQKNILGFDNEEVINKYILDNKIKKYKIFKIDEKWRIKSSF